MDTKERQKYQIISKGFNSLNESFKSLAKMLGVEVKKSKEISKTNFWQMVIDQFDVLSSTISQIVITKTVELKGDKGDKPSEEELLEIIRPLIPKLTQPEDGHTPTKEELLDLIRPLIPEVKDGETPSDAKLLNLIETLIPDLSEMALQASKLALDEVLPKIPTKETTAELVDRLDDYPKEWLSIDHIRGDFNTKIKPVIVPPYKPEIRVFDGTNNEYYVDRINFTGNGVSVVKMGDRVVSVVIAGAVTTHTETPQGDIDGVNAVFTTNHPITSVFSFAINGQFLHPEEYTIDENEITFNNPLPADLSGTNFTIIYA